MNLFRVSILWLLSGVSAVFGQADPNLLWPVPALPPGANPVATARPRVEWIDLVQANIAAAKGKSFDLVFDGDSITDHWRDTGKAVWAASFGGRRVVNFAISGDRVENLLWRLDHGQADGLHPKLIVLLIGTNDTWATTDQVVEGITAAVAEYRRLCPEAHLLLLGLFPKANPATHPIRAMIAEINRRLALLDDGKTVTFLDIGQRFLAADGKITPEIMPDELHPSAEGYRIWAEAIKPIVDTYVPPTP
jgi:lysophospholipase L1-like esterase